jgi:hypothetical protein
VQAARAHPAGVLRDERRQRAVGCDHHVAGAHAAGVRQHRALARRRNRGPRRAPLADPRPRGLGRRGQRAAPARRLEASVVVGQAGEQAGGAERGRKLLALDELAGEAVRAQRLHVPAHVLGLLLGDRQPQQAGPPDRVVRTELGGQLVDLPLRRQRARIDDPRPLHAVLLAGVVVEPGHAGDQEAAVAPAGAARHGAALEHDRLDAALGEAAGARETGHPGADHADVGLHRAREGRPRLVGLVEPIRRGAGAHARQLAGSRAPALPPTTGG